MEEQSGREFASADPTGGSARCNVSRALALRRNSSQPTPPSTTLSTSNAISRQLNHTACYRDRLFGYEEIVAALGYEPVGFGRSADAIAAVRAEPARFDAILVSQASAQAALDLARALHALAPRKPILLAARSAVVVGADALVRAGIADVVRRPIASAELAAALSRCLRSAAGLQM
jgi:hypothetical protein